MNKFSLFKGWAALYYPILFGLYLCCLPVMARTPLPKPILQQYTITGTVRDSQGVLPGVTVSVSGKSTATITDYQGNYSITATATDTLVFSFIGYTTLYIPIAGRTIVTVHLQEDATQLQEVKINAGYYTVKESERTGSIAKISATAIEKQPVSNMLATMQGRMAGVNVTQTTGVAGGGFDIQIRGQNSLRAGGNEPLYIVDGVPFASEVIGNSNTTGVLPRSASPLSIISPTEIESIEILKDADATAIYGSRGANGVVLITTKKGKQGKTQYTANVSRGTGTVTRFLDLMNTQQYLEMRKEAFANDGITTFPTSAYDVNGTWSPTRYTDWQRELTGGTSELTDVQTSVTGGSQRSQFYLGANYHKETTVFPGDFNFNRTSVRGNFSHASEDDRFRANFSVGYTMQGNDLPATDLTRDSRILAPNAPALYDAEGKLNWENGSWNNPLRLLYASYLAKSQSLIANSQLSYRIVDGLEFRTAFGFTDLRHNERRTNPSTLYNPSLGFGSSYSSLYRNTNSRQSYSIEPQLDFNRQWNDSKVSVLVGGTFQQQEGNQLILFADGFTSNSLLNTLAAASAIYVVADDASQYKYQAFFARANYTYKERYIVNLTGRRDGSSRFGPGKQFTTFGAIGTAWLFSREAFLANNSILSFGKLRASYGTTGSDQIGDYQFLDTYSTTSNGYQGITGIQPTRLFNPDFGWETNTKLEIALETGFLKDRIFLTWAWYDNRSSNQLVGVPLPGTTGFTSIQANLDATVVNSGTELSLRTVNLQKKDFSWTTDFNISFMKNKLVSFPNLAASTYRNQFVIGEPINIKLLYHYTGINPETGAYTFEDVNGDGVLTAEKDKKTIVDFNPSFYGGLQNQLRYQRLRLDFLFQFVKQQNYSTDYIFARPGLLSNQPVSVTDRWQQAGDVTAYQMYTTNSNSDAGKAFNNFQASDGVVTDASYIRLKNVSLSYDLPQNWTGQLQCRLFVEGQNLLTFTPYNGTDPEFKTTGFLPPLRMLSAGVQLTF
ncbi:SusC/RagA family TonB-linked outer membrane protein [Flavobacterium sp. LB2P84]|uniref:SusC/RagA family TonB-linked outer membrane protein n=1 Tax=Flavobacterium yafengii TaxID=3041253 RepID=UPI0024A81D5D|nr:SusC/RagA family TonB-linked outer membrane protein [Flavobacterium yafengii]MDI6034187.1 SusC/RagA family TonB-linked outer membrane protein [Flavobacterium yafengii]